MTRPITPNDLWRLPRVGFAAADGDVVVVPVTTFDLEANKGFSRIYRIDSRRPRPLTAPNVDAKSPVLHGNRMAFVRKQGDDPSQVWVMPLDGGEAEPVTDLPLGVLGAKWIPDGSGLVIVAPLFADAPTIDGTKDLQQARDDDPVKAHVTEDRVYRYWDRWLTDGKVPHLFRLDLDSGELIDLTPDSRRWWSWDQEADSFDVSTDEVVFSADTSEPPHQQPRWAIFTVPLSGGDVVCLTPDGTGHERRPRYSPDGSTIVYGMQREIDFYADRVRLVRYDRTDGSHTVLTEDWDRSASDWEFLDDGDLVFSAEDDAKVNLYRMPTVTGTPNLVARGGTFHRPVPGEGAVYATFQDLSSPPEIYRIPLGAGEPTRVTTFTASAMTELDMGDVAEMRFVGGNGDEVQMYVVFPPGFDPSRRWPLVHVIHGGPHGISGDQFHFRWNAQQFAAPGHVVAMVNFHGSTSWGQAFATSIHGAWGDLPTQDVMAATDVLIDTGYIDTDRMAITGGSYGGYLTAWLTTQTDRFRCAVAHAAVTDLPGMYASDFTTGRARAYGAEYWVDPDRVDRWSPSHHAAGYVTPTLVIHGERDFRVPLTQGLELYGVLKAKGVDARLVYYPDEHHWILKPRNSLHWYGEVLGWLERHLKPSTST